MKNKNNTLIGALIVLVGVSAVIAMIVFSLSKTSPEDGYFNPKKKATAQKIYEELKGVTQENYPISPEEVVGYYLKGTRLLLGDMVEDETVIADILRAQRLTYAKSLLEATSLEAQEAEIKENIKFLKDNNVCVVECSTKPVIFYEDDISKGYVRVTLECNDGSKYYFKYFLKRDEDGFWRIEGFRNSNEQFSQ